MTKLPTAVGASLVLLMASGAPLWAQAREVRTLEAAAEVVRDLNALHLKGIPVALLREAKGVAIIPGVVKAGFLVDGRIGRGVVLGRQPDGTWGNPVFVSLAGLGIGWQAGVASTDVVLVFKTARSVDRILRGKDKLTLGGDAAVAVGPLGREAEAATDARLQAEIYSYSRSRGLFAGVSLQGAALCVDARANAAFYGVGGQPLVLGRREVAALESLRGWLASWAPPTLPAVIVPAPAPPAVIAPAPGSPLPAQPVPVVPPPPPQPPSTARWWAPAYAA
jgi:lipid-binding SYLF domain-containing protein